MGYTDDTIRNVDRLIHIIGCISDREHGRTDQPITVQAAVVSMDAARWTTGRGAYHVIDAACQLGLITRFANPNPAGDQRHRYLQLTPAGLIAYTEPEHIRTGRPQQAD